MIKSTLIFLAVVAFIIFITLPGCTPTKGVGTSSFQERSETYCETMGATLERTRGLPASETREAWVAFYEKLLTRCR